MRTDYSRKNFGSRTGRRAPRSGSSDAAKTGRPRSNQVDWKPTLRLLRTTVLLAIALTATYYGGRYWWREYRWRLIIVHHSASPIGSLAYIKRLHTSPPPRGRGWSDIAYHYVINNGTLNTTVGQVEETQRWKDRRSHFSTKVPYANQFGIAVVMVGNFDEHRPARLQEEALVRLLVQLSRKYGIPPERIIGHRDLQKTACPGRHIDIKRLRRLVAGGLRN